MACEEAGKRTDVYARGGHGRRGWGGGSMC